MNRRNQFLLGMKHGIPIGLGYLAVSFAVGIFAAGVGITAPQGFFASLFTLASAGEYVGFRLFGLGASYWELIAVTFITNVRYLLMSSALSQKFSPNTTLLHRLGMGAYVTDEIFGLCIAREGYLSPWYMYGVGVVAAFPWATGTALGIVLGNVLPASVVSALGMALYSMFLAIVIPPARKSRPVLLAVAVSFAVSFLVDFLAKSVAVIGKIGEGFRVLILTLIIAGAVAALFPVAEELPQEEAEKEVTPNA